MANSKWTRRKFVGAGVSSAAVFAVRPSLGSSPDRHSTNLAGVVVRRNVYHMDWTGPEFAAYKEGVRIMKTRPADDPTSWAYQAAIHGTVSAPTRALYNTCTHHTYFFLPWHRAYLYYFERILQAAAGVATAALPYWNYSVIGQARLPEPFRLPAVASNPLYVPLANRAMTGSDEIDPSLAEYMTELAQTTFTSTMTGSSPTIRGFGGGARPTPDHFASSGFGGTLETGPHDTIHGAVGGFGGWMSDPNFAALDPIFWLHHANIDRLWNRWIEMGGGRANETSAGWLNTTYQFFDETKTQVSIKTSDVLNNLALNYRYDDDPCPPDRIIVVGVPKPPIRIRNICDRFPRLCTEAWPPIVPPRPGPLPPGPLQGVLIAKTSAPVVLAQAPVVLPMSMRGDRLRDFAQLAALRDTSPPLEMEIDVVDPAPGEIIRLDVQRASRAGTDRWLTVGQVGFFVPSSHKGLTTAEITVPGRIREFLAERPAENDVLSWRLRRVSGRTSVTGAEVPPAQRTVRIDQVRMVVKSPDR